MAMFFAFSALLACKLLKINKLLVEAAGVEPTSVLKTLNLLILGLPEIHRFP